MGTLQQALMSAGLAPNTCEVKSTVINAAAKEAAARAAMRAIKPRGPSPVDKREQRKSSVLLRGEKPEKKGPADHKQWAQHDVDQGPEHGTRYKTRGRPGFIKNVRGAYYVYVGKLIVGKFTSYEMATERLTRVRTSA